MYADKRGRLLAQPPRKLATSATQALCECWMSTSICALSDAAGVHKRVRSRNPTFPQEVRAMRLQTHRDQPPNRRVGWGTTVLVESVYRRIRRSELVLWTERNTDNSGRIWWFLLLLLRWHYSPMRTCASLMALSQSALLFDLSFQLLIWWFKGMIFINACRICSGTDLLQIG
jgi:hypothetical protein